MNADLSELAGLLRRRLEVIADHAWRERDPDGHLAALADASRAIDRWRADHAAALPARLRHFLDSASFAKALAWLEH